ncbi:MAG: hypothetical protein AAF456_24985 [Planctomycetota bacterium]
MDIETHFSQELELHDESFCMTNNQDSIALPLIRFGFISAGILALYISIADFIPNIVGLSMLALLEPVPDQISFLVSVAIAPCILLFLAYKLIRNSDQLARKLVPEGSNDVSTIEAAIYRVILTACGVVVLSWALPQIGQVLSNIIVTQQEDYPPEFRGMLTESNWGGIVYFCIQSAIGAYLIWGAPHLVKWQVDRAHGEAGETE